MKWFFLSILIFPINCLATNADGAMDSWLAIIAAVLMICLIIFILFRQRQQIIQVFKNYTKRHQKTDKASQANVSESDSQKSAESEKTWTLSGVDTQGDNIEFHLRETQLQKTPRGIAIGGSAKLSELTLKDNCLTLRHAMFSYRNNNLYVEDLNSYNKTEVDGVVLKPFEPRILSPENTLTLGAIKFKFKLNN